MLKISRGVEHVPEAERDNESYKDFVLKNRFSFGNVPTANFFQKSKRKSIFKVDIFGRVTVTFGLWVMFNTSANFQHSTMPQKKEIAFPRRLTGFLVQFFFEFQLPIV